jgi:hypothetical protein
MRGELEFILHPKALFLQRIFETGLRLAMQLRGSHTRPCVLWRSPNLGAPKARPTLCSVDFVSASSRSGASRSESSPFNNLIIVAIQGRCRERH